MASFPGVTDGIEQHIETEDEPGGSEGSWYGIVSRIEYARATQKGSEAENQDSGMEAGIAKKLGNADGVKASTTLNCGRTNIRHIQRWRTDGK